MNLQDTTRDIFNADGDHGMDLKSNAIVRIPLFPEPVKMIEFPVSAEAVIDEASWQGEPLSPVAAAFQAAWQSRPTDLGPYDILVEGLCNKVYMELAAQKHLEAIGVDLLAAPNGPVHISAGRGTRRFAPDSGLLQSLEGQGIKFGCHSGRLVAVQNGSRGREPLQRAEEPLLLPVGAARLPKIGSERAGRWRSRTGYPSGSRKSSSPSTPMPSRSVSSAATSTRW